MQLIERRHVGAKDQGILKPDDQRGLSGCMGFDQFVGRYIEGRTPDLDPLGSRSAGTEVTSRKNT